MAVARKPRPVWILIAVILALTIAGMLTAKHVYDRDIQPVSSDQTTQIFTVDKGSGVKQIADKLEKAHLIRSAWAFQVYIHREDLTSKLQAGTYALSPSESAKQIAAILSNGRTTVQLVTILPGRRIDQVRADLINSGFSPTAVDAALNPAQYKDLPVMALAPADVGTLEGLLWPDSWQRDATTGPDYIIRQSLTAMGDHLTPDIQAAFGAQGLSTYQGLILASIVVQEVNRPADQAQAAQVFLARLRSGSMLGSDVTARYGAIVAGKSPNNLSYDSPYNTHLHAGLPPTPISSISQLSLNASAHPASTNWLYFVTGDDGVTHFSTNLQDHQALTKQYCHKLCGN